MVEGVEKLRHFLFIENTISKHVPNPLIQGADHRLITDRNVCSEPLLQKLDFRLIDLFVRN